MEYGMQFPSGEKMDGHWFCKILELESIGKRSVQKDFFRTLFPVGVHQNHMHSSGTSENRCTCQSHTRPNFHIFPTALLKGSWSSLVGCETASIAIYIFLLAVGTKRCGMAFDWMDWVFRWFGPFDECFNFLSMNFKWFWIENFTS